jgi:hypothetical protein
MQRDFEKTSLLLAWMEEREEGHLEHRWVGRQRAFLYMDADNRKKDVERGETKTEACDALYIIKIKSSNALAHVMSLTRLCRG